MKHDSTLEPETYQHALEFLRIGNEAVHRAREENRRLGIPNVFSVNGHLCWELPNGEVTFDDPDADPG
ncbi:MAG TPA: hypothetical protein VGG06_34120 [Thermoanaerobaculia bacterium]|jgi:hypothetical protein